MMSEVPSIEKVCYTYGKTLVGKFCESVGLQEDNFPVRLYELDKEELSNGLIREITVWAKTKANKRAGKWKTLQRAIIDLYNIRQSTRNKLPGILCGLVKTRIRKLTDSRRHGINYVDDFLRAPFDPALPQKSDPPRPRAVQVAQPASSSVTVELVANPCCDVLKTRIMQLETEKNNLMKQNIRLQRQVEHFKVVVYKTENRMNERLKRKQAQSDFWRRKYIALLKKRNLEILKTRLRKDLDCNSHVRARLTIERVLKGT